jgi:hypothetical protein
MCLNFCRYRAGDNEYALAKAIESRDADLIFLTIFHLQRHLPFQVRGLYTLNAV